MELQSICIRPVLTENWNITMARVPKENGNGEETFMWSVSHVNSSKSRQLSQDLIIQYLSVAFLSTMFVHPVCGNPLPEDDATLKVSEYSFSEHLSNPCSLLDASRLQRGTVPESSMDTVRKTVISEMKCKTGLVKTDSENILRTNVLNGCSSLELPSVANIPSTDDISGITQLNVFRLFYTSLLNHTAHVYFISEQLQRHSEDDSCNSPELSRNARSLANDMKSVMCILRLSILTLQPDSNDTDSFEDSTDQILNEQLTDQPLCSRRTVRDCQTIRSTTTLLREFYSYLDSITSAADSTS